MSGSLLILALSLFFMGGVLIDVIVLRFFTIDESTLDLFKLILTHREIGSKDIPDAALIEIAAAKTEEAKKLAMSDAAGDHAEAWQRHLRRLLGEEADCISKIVRDGPQFYLGELSTRVLLKYGVVEPPDVPSMSVDEFVEAVKDGTLTAELESRLSLRNSHQS